MRFARTARFGLGVGAGVNVASASGVASPGPGDLEPPRASASAEPSWLSSQGLPRRLRWRLGRDVAAGCHSCVFDIVLVSGHL